MRPSPTYFVLCAGITGWAGFSAAAISEYLLLGCVGAMMLLLIIAACAEVCLVPRNEQENQES